jgi:hypothetical protein
MGRHVRSRVDDAAWEGGREGGREEGREGGRGGEGGRVVSSVLFAFFQKASTAKKSRRDRREGGGV